MQVEKSESEKIRHLAENSSEREQWRLINNAIQSENSELKE